MTSLQPLVPTLLSTANSRPPISHAAVYLDESNLEGVDPDERMDGLTDLDHEASEYVV